MDFSDGATPPNPAQHPSNFGGPWGGNEYASDADSPSPTNGINETGNEHLTVRFSYDNGAAYGDVLHALTNDPADFRIALHIQGIGPNGQYSVWGTTVPAPASAALLGLAGLAATRRRR